VGGSEFTLYIFGGSVPWGFPYAPTCDIATIVSQAWSGSVDGAKLVRRNEAQYGASSRYVLERVRSVTQRTHAEGSAVALVYSGNNEFIHLSPGRGTQGRGRSLMTAGERNAIVETHRSNLETSILALRRSGIEVVLSTIPTNLRDWPPSYTVLSEDQAENIDRLYSCAAAASRAGRVGEAEGLLGEILRSAQELAQAHFLLGRVHLAAGRPADGRSHLVAANDFDGRPIRATSAINHNIRTLAAERGIRLLDAEATFAATTPDGICGSAQFWDDCHPKLDGYIQLADLLSSHIADFVRLGDPPAAPCADEVKRTHGMDQPFLASVYGRVGLYCYKHSECWDSELTLESAEDHLRCALAMAHESVEAHIALALVLARRCSEADAREHVRTALRLDLDRALWLIHGREARANFGALGINDIKQWAGIGRAWSDRSRAPVEDR
jgi:tetratricopeptide (TPR) repeat protein